MVAGGAKPPNQLSDGVIGERLQIRPLTASELPTLNRVMPRSPGKHRERLAQQRSGEGIYLVAWLGDEPVGHAMVRWPSPRLERRGLGKACPQLEDVAVAPDRRRQGVGTAVMRRCEKEAAGHGFTELGFAVGVENAGARIFYARNGYSELERSRFTLRYAYVDARGNNREAEETCTNWIKALA